MTKKKHDLTQIESDLFRQYMSQLRQEHDQNQLANHLKIPVWRELANMPFVEAEAVMSHVPRSLSVNDCRRLKRSQFQIEGRLDLHGKTQEEALVMLSEFVAHQQQLHHRCVLIIHGKGGRVRGESAILKNLTGRWLLANPAVIAFHSAQARQGGAGATMVLLKLNSHRRSVF